MIDREIRAVVPTLLLPEVCGAIRRVTKKPDFSRNVKKEIESWMDAKMVSVKELNKKRMHLSSEAAIDLGIKGADAVFASLAKELNVKFLTFDEELRKRLRGRIKLLEI